MEKKTELITMRIKPSIKESLKVQAGKLGVSLSQLIENLLLLNQIKYKA